MNNWQNAHPNQTIPVASIASCSWYCTL